ncbi:transferrin receptor 1b [Syngnathoides biaculeatus]|uniref:transferrin receptor 1b n=1 Tax=Syngnathoides biaculeatus TaxID=300417 RepID=UPI002ADDA459|nr:transferrin receptor 1b [Syngnathoides biaculeatus]
MDQVKATVDNMIKSIQYSRFTLQRDDESDRHVEMKLSDDDGGEHVEAGHGDGSPSFRPAPRGGGKRVLCLLALGVVVVFAIGCLLGSLISKNSGTAAVGCSTQSTPTGVAAEQEKQKLDRDQGQDDDEEIPHDRAPLSWNEIGKLLDDKLTGQAFDARLKTFDVPTRSAGGEGDVRLANAIVDEFKALAMEGWTDVHYVQLQKPDSKRPNVVTFGADVFKPDGYLAYSATGKVEGKLVYAAYGRREDFDAVRKNDVKVNGSVLLLRAGNLSFAQQVANAEALGASAVLVYPDPADYSFLADTALYGHVHLGSGDPYTPGFPSFNHTQFPPTRSSALPGILAQTVTFNTAKILLERIGGPGKMGGVENVTVEVNNALVNTEIHNVFGVLEGFVDSDEYVVLGAQRDAWGEGYARAAVGCSVLMELAKAFKDLVERDGVRPRRSLVFASWGAGEYGSVGATEFLEGYLTSINRKLISYISLDGLVMGRGGFVASASPLLYSLLENTMKQVKSPLGTGSVYDMAGKSKWEANVLRPMSTDDPAYPFLAVAGVPAISFHFISPKVETYAYYGTCMDTADHLNYNTAHMTGETAAQAAQLAGRLALRLVHDHLLNLDVRKYRNVLGKAVYRVYKNIQQLVRSGELKDVDPNWLSSASGSFSRATANLNALILNSDLSDERLCRRINEKLMSVESNFLSPYVSPADAPFRHLLLGRGRHTMASLAETRDPRELRTQLALATWNIKMCANALVGDIWKNDNQI